MARKWCFSELGLYFRGANVTALVSLQSRLESSKTLTWSLSQALFEIQPWYFTHGYILPRSFIWYHDLWTNDLDIGVWSPFKKTLTWPISHALWQIEPWYCTYGYLMQWPGDHDLWPSDLHTWPWTPFLWQTVVLARYVVRGELLFYDGPYTIINKFHLVKKCKRNLYRNFVTHTFSLL